MKFSIPLEGMKAKYSICGDLRLGIGAADAKGGDAAMMTGYLGRKDGR